MLRRWLTSLWIAPVGIETYFTYQVSQSFFFSELHLLELKRSPGTSTFTSLTFSELHLLELKPVGDFFPDNSTYLWIAPVGIETGLARRVGWLIKVSELHLLELKPSIKPIGPKFALALNCTCWNWNGTFLYFLNISPSLWIAPVGIETCLASRQILLPHLSELHLLELKPLGLTLAS